MADEIWFYFRFLMMVGLVPTHLILRHSTPVTRKLMLVIAAISLFAFVAFGFSDHASLREVIVSLIGYSSALFVSLSEILMFGGALRLTQWRGEQWTKEIDYIYLLLGAVGLLASLSTLPNLSERIQLFPALGPLLVATAIVLRALKTRAEIAGWNRPP